MWSAAQSRLEWIYLLAAALFFAVGGFFMKVSAGATRFWTTFAFVAMFVAGALLQARAMRRADMGAVYIAVLGLEAALALGISTLVLREGLSWQRILAVCLIAAGVALLRR